MTEISERKKNGQIKGLISRRWLILSYTIQLTIPNVCTKFHHPMSSGSREIFDRKKVYTHTRTHTHKHLHRKSKNYIPPIYFVYAGGINIKGLNCMDMQTDLHFLHDADKYCHKQHIFDV